MRRWLALSVAVLGGSVTAADWPDGQGLTSDRNPVSLEKNAPSDWQIKTDEKKARNIKWATRVEGGYRATGGPVVAGGFVWVGTTDRHSDPKNEELDNAVLACFRASDGKLLYRYVSPRLKFPQDSGRGQSLSGSAASSKATAPCSGTNRREVICLDLEPLRTGKGTPREVWKLDMVKELKIALKAMMIAGPDTHGSPATPAQEFPLRSDRERRGRRWAHGTQRPPMRHHRCGWRKTRAPVGVLYRLGSARR